MARLIYSKCFLGFPQLYLIGAENSKNVENIENI